MPDRRRISKLLSLILRHRPDEFGLNMDEYGFIPLDEVVEAVQQRYSAVEEEDIRDLIETSRQRRFEIVEGRVRALYAHSFFVEMDGEPMDPPPDSLYMVASADEAESMREEGIKPEDRFYLHLSTDREAAASRSGSIDDPVLVEVRAAAAAQGGAKFYERGEVVLTRALDGEFVGEVVEIEGAPRRREDEEDDRPRRRGRDRDRDRDRDRGGRGRDEGPRRREGGGERRGGGGGSRGGGGSAEQTRRIDPKPEEMTYGRGLRFDKRR